LLIADEEGVKELERSASADVTDKLDVQQTSSVAR